MSTFADELPSNSDFSGSSQKTPWLLASNRKLRHLQGISIRNLVANALPATTGRRQTIDDENVPFTLQTPAKALALRENRIIHHSRSATDLGRPSSSAGLANTISNDNGIELPRKDKFKPRRRSTLPWVDVSPDVRQKRLEDIAESRMADSWFSLHCQNVAEPIYVSEVVEKAINPSFNYFDMNISSPVVSRLDQAVVKLWVRAISMPASILLLELSVDFKSLQYLGENLENYHHTLPPNCVIFHFTDGLYTNPMDLPTPVERPLSYRSYTGESSKDDFQPTSSYDNLMRLADLDDCVIDATVTRDRLERQTNSILERHGSHLGIINQVSLAQEKLLAVKRAVAAERTRLRQAISRKENVIKSLEARRDAMVKGRRHQEEIQSYLLEAQRGKANSDLLLKQCTEESMGQIRRICEEVQSVYPIEPVPEIPLGFTIRDLSLPNSSFDDMDKESVAGALGYTAHVVHLLSCYLSVTLPYPVKPYLSNSSIQDPVSAGLAQRVFPLYPVNTHYQFEYGVFLLNKNIEYLMNRLGLRILDIRQTLPNLKYLLYMLTAGSGELPARKVGGIRGLLVGRVTPSLSRQESRDSLASTLPPSTATSPTLTSKTFMGQKFSSLHDGSNHSSLPMHLHRRLSPSHVSTISKPTIGLMPRSPGAGSDRVALSMTVASPIIVNNERNNNISG
ncbi:hypothetical protein FQN57_001265 [Myotisia sp. PD_48]|nr:hypothetical protein FQN57_001265 [Myotisia sp. PD_48]